MLCPFCLLDITPERQPQPLTFLYNCPECSEQIPTTYVRDYRSLLPVTFSIIGQRAHGKSVYLASMLFELMQASTYWPQFVFGHVDESEFVGIRQKMRSLAKGQMPNATPRMFPRPAIARLEHVPGFGSCHFLMYDTAGEVFEDVAGLVQYGGYVTRSPAIIWTISLGDTESESCLLEFLETYIDGIVQLGGTAKNQTLLVVLTKGDELLSRKDLPQCIKNDLTHESVDVEDMPKQWAYLNSLSSEIETWLRDTLGYSSFVNRARQKFRELRFTVVSALGQNLDAGPDTFALKPRGVLRPLIWAMSVSDIAMMPECVLLGHEDRVTTLAFSGNGNLLASGCKDATVRIWDTSAQTVKRIFHGHDDAVWAMAFSPNGDFLATGGADRKVIVWNAEKLSRSERTFSCAARVHCIAFAPDSNTLAVGTTTGRIMLWDPISGRAIAELNGHVDTVTDLAFSPDGSTLVSSSYDGMLRMWETVSWKSARPQRSHPSEIYTVSYAPDGKTFASGGADGSVRLWDAMTGLETRRLKGHRGRIEAISFSPDGGILLSEGPQEFRLWSIPSGQLIRSRTGQGGGTHSIAFTSDGKYMATPSGQRNIALWRVLLT